MTIIERSEAHILLLEPAPRGVELPEVVGYEGARGDTLEAAADDPQSQAREKGWEGREGGNRGGVGQTILR